MRPGGVGVKPAAGKPMAKPMAGGAKPPGGAVNQLVDNRPRQGSGPGGINGANNVNNANNMAGQRPLSPPTAARGAPQRAISPPSAGGRAPLASEHKNSQVGLRADPKTKAAYGTIIRNWGANQAASKANLSMIEKKNLLALLALHRNNNVKVQSVASEVIDNLVELPDGSVAMEASKVNGFRPLVDLCKRDDIDAEIPILVVQALASLAAHPACRVPILTEVGWFNIPKFARAPEADMKIACANLLGNLSHEPKNQKIMIEKGVPLLLENLKEATTPELKSALYSAFADLARIKDHGAQKTWDESFLQYLIPSIMNDESQEEQLAAVALLSNVSDTPNVAVHNEIISSGLIDKLYTLLKSDVDDMQGNVALTFARIGKSAVGRQKFESFASFKNLIEQLTASNRNPHIQFQITGALDVLADSDAIKLKLKKEECVEALEEVILSTSTHAQVEELALAVLKKLDIEYSKIVVDKLSHTHKERPPMAPLITSDSVETTLSFSPPSSPRAPDVPPPKEVVAQISKPAAPVAGDVPPPRKNSMQSGKPPGLSSHSGQNHAPFAVGSMDAVRMEKDHQDEVKKLQDEKKRLEELLRKEREADLERSKYTVASPGSNIDDKIKGSLKSIQESINLEVDLLGAEKDKIEEWKRAIENFKGDRIIYEKDLEILKKDQQHLQQERGAFASDVKNVSSDKEKMDRERAAFQAEMNKIAQENARLKQEADALAKLREKFDRDRQDFDKERELLAKGNADQSSIDRERAERERQKAEAAEKAREQAERELQKADRERKEMEEMLEKERRKFKEELENERRRADEERERAASASNAASSGASREQQFAEKERYFEEIQLTFEKDKKRLEKEKAFLEEELARQREANGQSADEAARMSEFQKAIQLLEETVDESKKMNKTLGMRVEELEEELRRKREEGDRDRSDSTVDDSQKAWLAIEKRRLEELARKLAADQEELERRRREKVEDDKSEDLTDDPELDLDERERKQIAKDLKRLEEWEVAKEKEKEEAKRRLDEEIETLKQRHMSWERKKAIVMADLIEKENAIFEREAALQKLDDDLYQREVKVVDLEKAPARRELYDEYSDESNDRTEITHSDSDYEHRRRRRGSFSSENSWSDDQTITESVASDDDSPRNRKQREREEREREREREREKELEYERERAREKERERQRQREREKERERKKRDKDKDKLKSSKGSNLKGSSGTKASSPKPRPPFADLEPTEDEMDDDEDDIYSVEGLAHSDPYEAARKLLALLELDPTRANESTMDALRKFSKNRSGAPTQYEARDIIPALIHILRLCTPQSHEEIINICLLILAILAYNKDANQLYIRRAKGYDMYEIFLGCSIASVQARAALAIAAYALNNVPIKNEIGQSCVPKLVIMLKDMNPIIKKSGATALAAIVDNNKINKKVVKKLDGIKLLMELLKENQIPPKYSLHLLASLAHESKTIKRDAPKQFPNVFRKVVLLLSPYTKASVLVAAVACLVELARNNPHNQKEIHKAGATNYLVTILSTRERYNNDDLIANALFLCWVIAKICPKGLANPDFDTGKKSMAEILASLKEVRNAAVQKIISNMENMIRNTETAKGVLGSPSPYPPSPNPRASGGVSASPGLGASSGMASSSGVASSSASPALASSSGSAASPAVASSSSSP